MQKAISPYIEQLRKRNRLERYLTVHEVFSYAVLQRRLGIRNRNYSLIWIIRFLHRVIFACWSHAISFIRRISNIAEINFNESKLQLAPFPRFSDPHF